MMTILQSAYRAARLVALLQLILVLLLIRLKLRLAQLLLDKLLVFVLFFFTLSNQTLLNCDLFDLLEYLFVVFTCMFSRVMTTA